MEIVHKKTESRFEWREGSEVAVCEYVHHEGVWDLNHTYVPVSMRGAGVAAALAQAALEHVRNSGGVVRPSCSYIAAFIRRNPQYSDLLERSNG